MDALFIYGSRARGDYGAESDTDLLAFVRKTWPRNETINGITTTFVSPKDALKKCRSGDLFWLHVVREAVPIYDPKEIQRLISTNFNYKKSYQLERNQALDLAKLLINVVKNEIDWKVFNKRAAWCVRTAIIARLAEIRKEVFSAKEIIRNSVNREVAMDIISHKDSSFENKTSICSLKKFVLSEYGEVYTPEPVEDIVRRLSIAKNYIGLSTASSLLGNFADLY